MLHWPTCLWHNAHCVAVLHCTERASGDPISTGVTAQCACCYCCTAQEYKSQYDMVWLSQQRSAWLALMGDRVHDTVTFTDNHDLPRWLHANYSSISRFE